MVPDRVHWHEGAPEAMGTPAPQSFQVYVFTHHCGATQHSVRAAGRVDASKTTPKVCSSKITARPASSELNAAYSSGQGAGISEVRESSPAPTAKPLSTKKPMSSGVSNCATDCHGSLIAIPREVSSGGRPPPVDPPKNIGELAKSAYRKRSGSAKRSATNAAASSMATSLHPSIVN